MHRGDPLQRQEIVHHGEHSLLHLATVPSIDDHLFLGGDIKYHCSFRIQPQFLIILHLCLGCIIYDKIRLEIRQFICGRFNKHIGNEMRLPSHFHDEANCHTRIFIGSAESIYHIQLLIGKLLLRNFLDRLPSLLTGRMVVILVFLGGPPNGILGILILYDKFVFRRTTGINACHYIDRIQFCQIALVIPRQIRLRFLFEQHLI